MRSDPVPVRDELAPLERLPDGSRVWIFGTGREVSEAEAARLLESMGGFVADWAAHRRELRAGLDWRHGRFLHVAVDESATSASGCSIDALVGRLRELEAELDLPLVDTSPVWFRDPADPDRIRCVGREEFRDRARGGSVDGETVVFDLTVDRLGAVRRGAWELPAADSWHAVLLPEDAGRANGTGA